MAKKRDTYDQWEKDGILEETLKYVEELAAKRVIQKSIAEALGITAKTFTDLKNKHPRFNKAISDGDKKCRTVIDDAMFRVATGYDYYEDDQAIEEVNGKPRKKIVKVKKVKHPDFKALRYLAILKFGNEYNEKRFDYEMMNKEKLEKEEVWENANKNDED